MQGQANLGVGGGVIGFGGQQGGAVNRYQSMPFPAQALVNRLTFEQLQQRRKANGEAKDEAKKTGSAIAEFDPTGSVNAAAQTETVGDQVRYTIDHKITLARQRSALLPIVNAEVTARSVSIFNGGVHGKFPLRGLKIKNTTGQNLMQGPIAVYEEGAYAGDAQMPDVQAGEERLLSFAVDQGIEVKAETKSAPEVLTTVRIVKGVVQETHRMRQTTSYLIKNRSGQERNLIVEHPVDPEWKLVGEQKPAERSRDFYRFEWPVASGASLVRDVVQEKPRQNSYLLMGLSEDRVGLLLRSTVITPKLKEALQTAIELQNRLNTAQREQSQVQSQYQNVVQEQARVRSNLDKVPANSALQKRYLDKLDKLETQLEKLQGQSDEKQEQSRSKQKELENYLGQLSVE
jgi:hypothetical protein